MGTLLKYWSDHFQIVNCLNLLKLFNFIILNIFFICHSVPPRVTGRGYRCRLCSLGNLSTALGSCDRAGTVSLSYSYNIGTFFCDCCTTFYIFTLLFLLSSVSALFYSCCTHAQVFRRTLMHEFHILIAILNGTCFFAR